MGRRVVYILDFVRFSRGSYGAGCNRLTHMFIRGLKGSIDGIGYGFIGFSQLHGVYIRVEEFNRFQ